VGNWIPLAARQGGIVPTIVLSPDFPADGTAFAATHTGVFRSSDGGRSWEIRVEGLGTLMVQSLALSPNFATDRTLFAGTADGNLYRSGDAGESWTFLARPGGASGLVALAVAPGPGESTTIVAGTAADGLFVSEDGGRTWEARVSGLADRAIIALALSPAFQQDRIAFVATEKGLHRTADGGSSWKLVWTCPEGDSLEAVVVSPGFAADRIAFAGTEGQGILRSSDGGSTWQTASAGLPDLCINALALSPNFARDRLVMAGTGGGVVLSADGGASWRVVAEERMALSVALASPRLLLAGLVREGVIRSGDGGTTWEAASYGLFAASLVGLALSPAFESDDTLFAWGPSEELVRSTDGGKSWAPVLEGLGPVDVASLGISPAFAENGRVYIATSDGMFVSDDQGATWRRLGLEGHQLVLLALSPAFPEDGVMVAAATGSLHLSTDGGASWAELEAPVGEEYLVSMAIALDPARKPVLLVGSWRDPSGDGRGRLSIWRRTLPNEPWANLFSRPTNTRVALLGMPDSYGEDQRFFIGNGESVYRLVPDATERTREGIRPLWLPGGIGRASFPVLSLVAAPDFAHNHTLYASTSEGVYVSRDEARTWQKLAPAPGNRPPVAIDISPGYPKDSLYALALGGRLWRWDPAD